MVLYFLNSFPSQNTLQTDQSGAWQMQHMALTGAPNLATLAAEEIRVDCLLMTSDGHNVVTGSIYGPPQAWDLSVGGAGHPFKGTTDFYQRPRQLFKKDKK